MVLKTVYENDTGVANALQEHPRYKRGRVGGHSIGALNSFVGSGDTNQVILGSDCSMIGGGFGNTIDAGSPFGVIAGGNINYIGTGVNNSFIGGGSGNQVNTGSHCSAIAGGEGNIIDVSSTYGFIGGGSGNYISQPNNAILGGVGNNDGGIPFTGMYGNGLIATPFLGGAPPSAFWVDELIVPNIPVITTPAGYANLPAGALYTTAPPLSGYLASPVYVA